MSACPSDLGLESYLLRPEDGAVARHVAACAECQARLAEMRRLGEEFQRAVYPNTVGSVVAAAPTVERQPRFPRWRMWAAPLAAAAALIAVVLWREGGVTRRAHLDLAVYVDRAAGAERVVDGAVVPADAALRFEVQPGSPCNLWVLSVDASGDIVRLYPPKGDRAAEAQVHPPRRHELPTVAVLDGRTGPQRIFAVCTRSPVPWNTVKTAAAERVGKGEDAIRSYRSISGLPAGATQTTVLVEKRS